MSQMSANIIKPIYAALPAEERRAFAAWVAAQEKDQAAPKPLGIAAAKKTLHQVADQIGDFYRPGMEEQAISEIMFSN